MAKGKKTGGRVKGSPNKRTRELEKAAASGLLPLDYMLAVMRNVRAKLPRRDDMAKAAAPYLHARRAQAVELTGKDGGPVVVKSIEGFDWDKYADLQRTLGDGAGNVNEDGIQQPVHPAHTNGKAGTVPEPESS